MGVFLMIVFLTNAHCLSSLELEVTMLMISILVNSRTLKLKTTLNF